MARDQGSLFRSFSGLVRAERSRLPLALLILAAVALVFGTTGARLLGAVLLVWGVFLLTGVVRDLHTQEQVLAGLAMATSNRRLSAWRTSRASARTMQKLTLDDYRGLLAEADVASPSLEQVEDFAFFVAAAHSWYKHLPLLPPGLPMTFFVDPGAGAQLIVDKARIHQLERLEHGFHYSWLPTKEYRRRFGHASFARSPGTGTKVSLQLMDWWLIPSDDQPAIYDLGQGELVALPDEVVEAGTAFLSGAIHPRASYPLLWRHVKDWDAALAAWPAESGGPTVLSQIRERAQALIADQRLIEPPPDALPDTDLFGCDIVLYRLLAPERQRQRRGIAAALDRVADLAR